MIAAAAGSAINSIAGGGTLVTFPAIVGLGVPPIVANATSTVALWPGALGSIWGYRDALAGARRWAAWFALPSLVGGLLGALLLLATPAERFEQVVPWLVLLATVLFMAQRPLMTILRRRRGAAAPGDEARRGDPTDRTPPPAVLGYQFAVAVYGGYFGAGIGILMLAALGFMGFTSIHRMNGLKNWGGLCMNAVAAATFAFSGLVDWPVAIAMAAGAIAGGYGGSRLAQRVPQELVRRAIMVIGLASAFWLAARR
ncbi:MAG TPA: sulfite exporter TauE/SafE family protein [Gemmatimonadaceae bacterium]|nr:sulfite exporter TauE/SafE family protein [Gemmatimonadaceae bacterium]